MGLALSPFRLRWRLRIYLLRVGSMAILNTNLKIFHYPEKLHSLPPSSPTVLPPLHIRIKPTNVCNHHCWFCCYRQDDFQLGATMVERDQIPLEKMMEIVDD